MYSRGFPIGLQIEFQFRAFGMFRTIPDPRDQQEDGP